MQEHLQCTWHCFSDVREIFIYLGWILFLVASWTLLSYLVGVVFTGLLTFVAELILEVFLDNRLPLRYQTVVAVGVGLYTGVSTYFFWVVVVMGYSSKIFGNF